MDNLTRLGYQIGGSAIVPIEKICILIGKDINIIPDFDNNTNYFGLTSSYGLAKGTGSEFHIERGTTKTWKSSEFNIFDFAKSICYILGG